MNRVKLKGGPSDSSSSVEIKDDGSLVVEFYDFSEEAESCFGNDVAYQLIISKPEAERILSKLIDERNRAISVNDELLQLMEERFQSYFDVKEWLEANGITYQKIFDSWA